MNRAELFKAIESAVGKAAYIKFSKPQKTPYAIFALPDKNVLHADNRHYAAVSNGWLELYMNPIDFELMKRVELVFIDSDFAWEKENEGYIDGENVFYARWSFDFIEEE